MRALLALVVVIALSTMGCGSKDKVKKVEKTTPEKPARTGAREPPKTGSADDPGSQVPERQPGQEEEQPAASPDAIHALTGGVDAGEADTIPNSSARVKDGAEVTPKPTEAPPATGLLPDVGPADPEPPPNPDRFIVKYLLPGRFDASTLERMEKTLDKIRSASLSHLVNTFKLAGETEAALRIIFERAREHAPAIVLFDEIDCLGMSRAAADTHHQKSW